MGEETEEKYNDNYDNDWDGRIYKQSVSLLLQKSRWVRGEGVVKLSKAGAATMRLLQLLESWAGKCMERERETEYIVWSPIRKMFFSHRQRNRELQLERSSSAWSTYYNNTKINLLYYYIYLILYIYFITSTTTTTHIYKKVTQKYRNSSKTIMKINWRGGIRSFL